MMENNQKQHSTWWIWLLVALAVIGGIILIGVLTQDNDPYDYDYSYDEYGYSYPDEKYISLLKVEGTMSVDEAYADYYGYYHQFLLDEIDWLMEDEYNAGLLLFVNSGGGEVLAGVELAEKIQEYKEVTGRPVVAYGYSINASAAYWVSCVADRVIMNKYCLTGSIGVTMGSIVDVSGLLTDLNISVHDLSSGDEKNSTSGLTPITQENLDVYQDIIDEYFSYFVEWVAEHRGMDVDKVYALADGRVYSATQSVALGLADQVGDYEYACDLMEAMAGTDYWIESLPPMGESFLDMLLYGGISDMAMGLLLEDMQVNGLLSYYDGM